MRIDRDAAVERVRRERAGAPCLLCAVLEGRAGPRFVLAEDPHAVVLLSRYALRPGHLIVVARHHVTSFGEVPSSTWAAMADQARLAARVLERELHPVRCYVASLGSDGDAESAPMTSPHLHLHVVPVHDPGERPSGVLTWEHGVHVEPDEAHRERLAQLVIAWNQATGWVPNAGDRA